MSSRTQVIRKLEQSPSTLAPTNVAAKIAEACLQFLCEGLLYLIVVLAVFWLIGLLMSLLGHFGLLGVLMLQLDVRV